METRHIKDLTVALVVIILIAFLIQSIGIIRDVNDVPEQSIYEDLVIDQELIDQIQDIERSIIDRQQFVFTVTRDPLEQSIVVRTQVDLEEEWRREVEAMMRLAATYIDERGNRKAVIDYQGKQNLYGIGDYINDSEIVDINSGQVTLAKQDLHEVLEVKPIPPKPAALDRDRRRGPTEREYVW